MPHTLFISDLHLDAARPAVTELFLAFLREEAVRAEALYILGDLFEAWIGDDDDDPAHASVIEGLRTLNAQGVALYFMHGNRDFLIGTDFAAHSGCALLADPTLIDLYGTPTLLMHGDTLCTDDVAYQRRRVEVRDPAWQRAVLARPLTERRHMAAALRAESEAHKGGADYEIMDVNPAAVTDALRQHNVRRLIHGHTHRPAIHDSDLDGEPAQRIVLGDWYEQGSVLYCDADGCTLQNLPLPTGS